MITRARIRKAIKWGGAVVCVVIAAVWLTSAWAQCVLNPLMAWVVLIDRGEIGVGYVRDPTVLGWLTKDRGINMHGWESPFDWSFFYSNDPTGTIIVFPLWAGLLAALAPTLLAWRLDARARRPTKSGLCASCGYDLAGLPSAQPCPECGKKTEPAA